MYINTFYFILYYIFQNLDNYQFLYYYRDYSVIYLYEFFIKIFIYIFIYIFMFYEYLYNIINNNIYVQCKNLYFSIVVITLFIISNTILYEKKFFIFIYIFFLKN